MYNSDLSAWNFLYFFIIQCISFSIWNAILEFATSVSVFSYQKYLTKYKLKYYRAIFRKTSSVVPINRFIPCQKGFIRFPAPFVSYPIIDFFHPQQSTISVSYNLYHILTYLWFLLYDLSVIIIWNKSVSIARWK